MPIIPIQEEEQENSLGCNKAMGLPSHPGATHKFLPHRPGHVDRSY